MIEPAVESEMRSSGQSGRPMESVSVVRSLLWGLEMVANSEMDFIPLRHWVEEIWNGFETWTGLSPASHSPSETSQTDCVPGATFNSGPSCQSVVVTA